MNSINKRTFNKRTITLFLVGFIALFSATSQAKSPIYTSFFSNVAVSGYDSVAYFTQGKAVKGNSKFSTDYQGATWHFSSEQNLALFTQAPAQYAPQYGGYCAWAVAKNDVASSDPLAWRIIDNKLYLNYNLSIQAKWLKDPKNLIIKANKHWPNVLN